MPLPAPGRERVLPTGAMHLAFRLSGDPLVVFDAPDDPRGRRIGHAVVGGVRSACYIRDLSSAVCSAGAVLRPGTAELLFGAPAEELSERHTPLEGLWGAAAGNARDRLGEAAGAARRLEVLEALLRERLPAVRGLHPAIARALEQLELPVSVSTVAGQSGFSHRHFVVLFRRAVGLTPKMYGRVRRLGEACRRIAEDPSGSLARVALDTGYSDQAHCTRDFVELTGLTPGAYRASRPRHPSHVRLAAPRRPGA